MKRKIETAALWMELILASGLLVMLILSDFGLIFTGAPLFARVIGHLTAILLILSASIQLLNRKKK